MKNYKKMLAKYIKSELSPNPAFREQFEKVCTSIAAKRHTALKTPRSAKNEPGS
jgi:hypothetical protein